MTSSIPSWLLLRSTVVCRCKQKPHGFSAALTIERVLFPVACRLSDAAVRCCRLPKVWAAWRCCLSITALLCIQGPSAALTEKSFLSSDNGDTSNQGRVALAVQGKCKDLLLWQDLLAHQHNAHQVDLVFLVFETQVDTCHDAASSVLISAVVYGPNTTWSSGRNMLAKAIYQKELAMESEYKYWIMADSDMRHLKCHNCRHMEKDAEPACCFDLFVQFLLGPQQFAMVAINGWDQNPEAHSHFSQHECPDGMLNAFHRAAVSVLLPYNDAMEDVSWWFSQEIMFHLAYGCVKGGVVTLGGYTLLPASAEHAKYPRGLDAASPTEIIKEHYWPLIPWPVASAEHKMLQKQCASNVAPGWKPTFTSSSKSSAWQRSQAYEVCLKVLQPHFRRFMLTSPFTKTSPRDNYSSSRDQQN